MKIKELPWYNRPRFKLTKKGVESLDDTELLSLILSTTDKDDDTLELSNKILKSIT